MGPSLSGPRLGLQLAGPEEEPSHPPVHVLASPRSTSSKYPSEGHGSPNLHSPSSTVRVNRLSPSDLSCFARGNHRLSFLRSTSSASEKNAAATDNHEAMDEATAAISRWRDEPRAHNKYALVDSSDMSSCDSTSQRENRRVLDLDSTTQRESPKALDPAASATELGSPDGPRTESGGTWDSIGYVKNQYDGVVDIGHLKASRSTSTTTPPPRHFKRKASIFSLPSFSMPLTKRRRLANLRKWATDIYHGGGRRLSHAYHRWRQQRELNRKLFEDWRAKRRRERPADPLPGKKSKPLGFGLFTVDRSRHGNEEWWKEGVAKYRAPSWMQFQK
ncbi:hypothetical protein XA68_14217 [Ophiocordyceps unilateralis]|uniref:Uncharacterized protein n=1 Tax=Ophiocordyceps unilateralis TaxID=268505 RepID=A0A2A9PA32_OPHUN|nr:hypothetical protein XA68_14217 [Ophiocordyceps unilateralis]